jgi:hydrogenase maturation protease
MKTIILGLGNTILTDDGAGIYVVREIKDLLKSRIPPSPLFQRGVRGDFGDPTISRSHDLTIQEASLGGFNFIDLLEGYDRAVIVDAIHTKDGKPGEFYELDPSALKPSARLSSLHQIDFATACELAKNMEIAFPKEIAIFVMEVEDEFSFGEKPTPKVEAAIPKMAVAVINILEDRGWIPVS